MTISGAWFVLYLLMASGQVVQYDAQFGTVDECLEMGRYHEIGINGPVVAWECKFTVES